MKRAVVVLLLMVICSCSKITESDIPYARVWFKLDLRYSDKDLVPLLSYKEFTSPRAAGEYTGYAGLLSCTATTTFIWRSTAAAPTKPVAML